MSNWLDVVGSFIIGGIAILILANLNFAVNSAASENLYSGIMQRNVTSAADLIDHDFYKIGYRFTGNKVVLADSNEVKFYSDIDNDGISDEIHYYVSDTKSLMETANPNDYILTRKKNNEKTTTSIAVVEFNLAYFDSLGQTLDYSSLKSQSERDRIRTIGVRMKCESAEMIDGKYEAVEWEKTIKPKNI